VAKSSLGKAVSRVGASGGGRTYAKTRPAAYYFVLAIIVVLGLASVGYSRYERTHPVVISTAFPAKGSQGYFALALDACGTAQPYLKPTTNFTSAFTVLSDNLVRVTPTTASQANANANVGAFISHTPGLSFTNKVVTFPGPKGTATKATTFTAGQVCAPGTRYAGKKAYPVVGYWENLSQRKATLSNLPSGFVLNSDALVSVAFLPKGVQPSEPSAASITAMFGATASTTTSSIPLTIPTSTSTSLPFETTSTKPATTTTKK
jgi:hypothetical protein